MVKHDGVYWYWSKGAWRQVPKVAAVAKRRGRYPADYVRTTCRRCGRRPTKAMRKDGYCSAACAQGIDRRTTAYRQAQAGPLAPCARCHEPLTRVMPWGFCAACMQTLRRTLQAPA